jgi:RNA polymerase sigma-70 factor, ECF subfamily
MEDRRLPEQLTQKINCAKAGNHDAFAALQAEFEPRIRRFAQRMIRNGDDVEDIVQRTFIALYINIERIDPPEKLLPFLLRVTRNLCYDALRQYYNRDEMDIDECEYRLSSPGTSPESSAHWALLFQELRRCIDCLPDVQRDTLILYAEENLSQTEIAEVMNTEVGTVKSRLHYARKLLRQMLPSEFFETLDMEEE